MQITVPKEKPEGVYALWLAVLTDAVLTLQRWPHNETSHSFIFDNDNQFFDFVSEKLEFEPDLLRQHIRSSVEAAGRRTRMPYIQRSPADEGDDLDNFLDVS